MTNDLTQNNDNDERREQLLSFTRESESNRDRSRDRRDRRVKIDRESVRLMINHDMNNEDDSLIIDRLTLHNSLII